MDFRERWLHSTPVFLAPMAGVTDAPFRDLVMNLGATAVVSEMISSEALVRQSSKTYERLLDPQKNIIKIIQLMGGNPNVMAKSAIINEELGADVIDINIGCPARKVVSNNSGAALMKNENLVMRIVESVVKSVKIPVTLKMRLGWDNENINFLSLAKKFEDIGIQMLAIHCRTRSQMYGGKASWSKICELRNTVKIPYLCNGDIKSAADAICALKESQASGVMVGRATLGKPWLLNQIMKFLDTGEIIPSPSLEEQFEIIMKHFQAVLDFYGAPRGVKIFRKHFCWYSRGLEESSNFREVINQSEDLSFIKNYVKDFYEKRFKCYHMDQEGRRDAKHNSGSGNRFL
ncbi:MAG: tRNA dihydrouridine synthase DusB [Holosporaceae bacterium]|jgi:tRNA-dihydrouridine synthase B|nr:tRNA dihydrouridine synthase DusB [Holosporaceae bacterium]